LNLSADFEFHFAHNSKRQREAFLKAIFPYQFSIITVDIFKDKNSPIASAYTTKETFYKYACHNLMVSATPYLEKAVLIMDEGNSKAFYSELRRYLREKMHDQTRQKIKKIKPQDSKKNNLLQVADYCVSISARKAQEKKDWEAYYKYISPKVLVTLSLP
jgi:hypothetical protein